MMTGAEIHQQIDGLVANTEGGFVGYGEQLMWTHKSGFPGLVEYVGVTGLAYIFDHYAVAPDAVDRDDQEFNNKAERVKQELWVSLSIM